MAAEKTLKKGDAVTWKSQGKSIKGHVVKKVTQRGKIKSHSVAASKDHPEYLVESDATGKQAAHPAESLRKTSK